MHNSTKILSKYKNISEKGGRVRIIDASSNNDNIESLLNDISVYRKIEVHKTNKET